MEWISSRRKKLVTISDSIILTVIGKVHFCESNGDMWVLQYIFQFKFKDKNEFTSNSAKHEVPLT